MIKTITLTQVVDTELDNKTLIDRFAETTKSILEDQEKVSEKLDVKLLSMDINTIADEKQS